MFLQVPKNVPFQATEPPKIPAQWRVDNVEGKRKYQKWGRRLEGQEESQVGCGKQSCLEYYAHVKNKM